MIPAHVTSTSSDPRCSTAAATAASTSVRDVTSQETGITPRSLAIAWSAASSRSATTTVAPSAAKRAAAAAPIPLAPPVISAVLPSSRISRTPLGDQGMRTIGLIVVPLSQSWNASSI